MVVRELDSDNVTRFGIVANSVQLRTSVSAVMTL
jgi:hypothetical protein